MADHMYKPSEVPKGQRWQHFLDYYKIPTIIAVLLVIAVISILKSTVFSVKPDVTILAASKLYVSYDAWDEATAAFAEMPLDYNNDGKSTVTVEYINLDDSMQQSDPEVYVAYQTKLMASLSSAESALQIVDEDMFTYFVDQQLAATYAELEMFAGHEPQSDYVKIPLKELAPFRDMADLPDGLFLTVRPQEAMQIGNSKKKQAKYENQLAALEVMLQS